MAPLPSTIETAKLAMVKDQYSKPPILHEGDLTFEVAKEYKIACLDFFDTTEVEDADQHVTVVKLSFADFMKEIQAKYLLHNWKSKICICIMSSNFNPLKQTFWDFVSYLQKLNSLLFNTLLHFETGGLCTQIKAKLDSLLLVKYFKKSLNTITNFYKWLDSICQLNKSHHQSEKHQCRIADEVFRQSKKLLLTLNKVNTTSTLAQWSLSTSSSMKQKLLPLMNDEKCLLHENSECYCCCCPYVTCCTGTCKKSFLDATTYITLMQATYDATKAVSTHASNPTAAAASVAPSLSSPTIAAILSLASFMSIKEMDDSFADFQASDDPMLIQ
ncbi:hypothetical protein C0995_002959 [Termitomyces sp. Mi166|nr:hypothetical protein C0995_002959 [Termitomyces sp. Mi166\